MIHRIHPSLQPDAIDASASPALTSLEDRLIQTLQSGATSAEHYKRAVLGAIVNPSANPGEVLKLQMVSAEHTTRTTVISALAKKATGTIETLLKS